MKVLKIINEKEIHKPQNITQETWKNKAVQLLQKIIIPYLLDTNIMK